MKKAHKIMKTHLQLFDCNLFLKEILIFYVSNTWNYLPIFRMKFLKIDHCVTVRLIYYEKLRS